MKRLDAGRFLAINSFPSLAKRDLTVENNKINGVIQYAINADELNINAEDELDTVAFLRWASKKKKGNKLKWPWLIECIDLPFEPITGGGVLVRFEDSVVPSDIKECQDHLVKAWQDLAVLQKQVNVLLKENEELKVKRQKRIENGKAAAEKQWKQVHRK